MMINEAVPLNDFLKKEEKQPPIECCANLNSIKDFLIALSEFIKCAFKQIYIFLFIFFII